MSKIATGQLEVGESIPKYVRHWILGYANNSPIYQYLLLHGYDAPIWFGIDHWANDKTAIELGIAIDKTIKQPTNV